MNYEQPHSRRFLGNAALVGIGAALASCTPKNLDLPIGPVPAAAIVQPTAPQGVTAPPTSTPAPRQTQAAAPTDAAPTAAAASAIQALSATPPAIGDAYLAVAHGARPEEITRRAIAALGGMERFVKPGYEVIVKPNICNASHSYEYASTTNPGVVAILVRLALGAGAKNVRVMDYPFSGSA